MKQFISSKNLLRCVRRERQCAVGVTKFDADCCKSHHETAFAIIQLTGVSLLA